MNSAMKNMSATTTLEDAMLPATSVGGTIGGMGHRVPPTHFGFATEPRKRLGESPSPIKGSPRSLPDMVCFSPLPWSAQSRPRQLMSRCARSRRVFFVEEPMLVDDITGERERLMAAGIQANRIEAADYTTIMRLRDPDGNLVVLAQPGRA